MDLKSFASTVRKTGSMYDDMVLGAPQLQRGMVWCKTCGRSQKVDAADCLRHGWPKCHGYTMTLDAPNERPA